MQRHPSKSDACETFPRHTRHRCNTELCQDRRMYLDWSAAPSQARWKLWLHRVLLGLVVRDVAGVNAPRDGSLFGVCAACAIAHAKREAAVVCCFRAVTQTTVPPLWVRPCLFFKKPIIILLYNNEKITHTER